MFTKITVKAYEIVAVFQDGQVIDLLTTGSHWISWGKTVQRYDSSLPLMGSKELNILLEYAPINKLLKVVEIKDNELGFEYKDGNFSRVLQAGRYAYWDSIFKYEVRIEDLESGEIAASFPRKLLMRREVLPYFKVFSVESYEKGLFYINGVFERILASGTYYFWNGSKTTTLKKADLRTQQMEISGQEILTKDKVALRINFDVQYKVVDIEKALNETNNYVKQMYTAFQLVLREYIGSLVLDNILSRREEVAPFIIEAVAKKLDNLGITVSTCGIRDIILPGEVKAIINQVLIAQKTAQANNIMRQEETAATRSLLNTAKLMEQNEMLFKLKEMEYVEKIAAKIGEITIAGNSKVIDQLKNILS